MDKLLKEVEIIFDCPDYVVLNKPAGLSVHGDGKSEEKTLVDFLLKKFPEIKDVGEPTLLTDGGQIDRPGIVHRIDKETSGVLLVAKTEEAFYFFKDKFKSREISKTYFTFVYGKPKFERGMINLPIGRGLGSVRKWETGKRARGEMRDALTKYKVLKHGINVSLLEVWPMTGRTHQIRVHMKAIGHPIVGDSLYAPTKRSLVGFRRLALHASRLIFDGLDGREKEYTASFPADFEAAADKLAFQLRK